MYARASELGWSYDKFHNSTLALFNWEWQGYERRMQRMIYLPTREIYAILHNVNVKKGGQKKSSRLMPLDIDKFDEWTYEKALNQYEKVKELGWLKN